MSEKKIKFASKFSLLNMDIENLVYKQIEDPCQEYGKGIAYESMMKRQIKKHSSFIQPLFEAISNALESNGVSKIEISLGLTKTLIAESYDFVSLHITDNGEGFNDKNFDRFVTLFDDTKGFNNFGTGRIQFLHFFRITQIRSVYISETGEKRLRTIVLSNSFYQQYRTSILTKDEKINSDIAKETTISFFYPINTDDKSLYNELTTDKIKHEILTHYLCKFCLNKGCIPKFHISSYINEVEDADSLRTLTAADIPDPDFDNSITIPFSTLSDDGKSIIKLSNQKADFRIQSFPLPYSVITKNEVKLTSKGESVDSAKFDFNLIREAPRIGDSYMLFLISSDYLTQHDQDERGKLLLISKKELLSQRKLFSSPEIVIEDIQNSVVEDIINRYPVIKEAKEKYDLDLAEMAELFSLDLSELQNIGLRIGETTESLLKRYHEYNGAIQAKKEAQVKDLYDSLTELEPGANNYKRDFQKKVDSLNLLIPELVRSNLSKYIARRKLVLKIFELALKKELQCQGKKKNSKTKIIQHEKFLHNIIFPQHSEDAKDSNLWLISDEFIHFDGLSEKRLVDVTIKGESFLRDDLTDEERKSLQHFDHDDITSRPDILLFPEEHKCVIIEFKSPTVELSNQVEQICQYASVIREFAKSKFEITSFYAYLIGEKIDNEAFRRKNPEFRGGYYFDYLFNPDKQVYGGRSRENGHMYIEIIKFSTLLERAKMRNKIFTDQIDGQ